MLIVSVAQVLLWPTIAVLIPNRFTCRPALTCCNPFCVAPSRGSWLQTFFFPCYDVQRRFHHESISWYVKYCIRICHRLKLLLCFVDSCDILLWSMVFRCRSVTYECAHQLLNNAGMLRTFKPDQGVNKHLCVRDYSHFQKTRVRETSMLLMLVLEASCTGVPCNETDIFCCVTLLPWSVLQQNMSEDTPLEYLSYILPLNTFVFAILGTVCPLWYRFVIIHSALFF